VARRFAWRAGRNPGAGRWGGFAGRQARKPQSPGRPDGGLTRVIVASSDGAAAPTRQPHWQPNQAMRPDPHPPGMATSGCRRPARALGPVTVARYLLLKKSRPR
jgi:hypothetical protein